MQNSQIGWLDAARIYTHPRVLAMFFLGFSAGLPFLLVFATLTAWLTDAGVARSAIGFFGWIGITYSIKVLWAPVVDRLVLPVIGRKLGQRRSWMLLGQLGIAAGLAGMAFVDPVDNLAQVALLALLVAFASSTQDVAIDAYRIEAVITHYQGAMSASYVFGYKVALLVAGAGALFIADFGSWLLAYLSMAALMGVGVITVLLVAEPERDLPAPIFGRHKDRLTDLGVWFSDAVISPFTDFFNRNGSFALVILLFIAVFRLSDITMGIMANPFYLDLGFSKSEIASVAKVFGFFMSVAGSFLCGVLVVRWGVYRPLMLGAVLVASTNILFAVMAQLGPDIRALAVVISADNISGGIAATAFVAYLSGLTNRAYTATQYALFSSLMTLPGKFFSGFSGLIVDASGYTWFFLVAAAVGIPAILLVPVLARREAKGQLS
ncbi:PAT family beta-lactamase induction signal transducer AmpG [Litorivivens lipolytica]|uniref:PAT family beta-lactamase induction signal transducer AmpG n=1 Tax=Litorivivens lipolytica TaxID=1524264 RepID=A0A7W4W1J7_9GAMM|nr:MFS transporter [Litorivivens lipolytica]MBB3045773.1 PAT family beta-lactamase induction signal transducer AmpG [Litorivivens lipolytica]